MDTPAVVSSTVAARPTEVPVSGRVGRRRNPDIDEKSLQAALHVYVDRGWEGFTFDAVAREAGVGKPALYRRWESPAHLLIDAFGKLNLPSPRDCGSLRSDLLDYGNQYVEWYSHRERAYISMRLTLDRWNDDHLAELFDRYVRKPRIAAAIQMSEAAVARGEIQTAVTARTAIELLLGSMLSHFTQTAESRYATFLTTFPVYVEDVVQIIVAGIQATSPIARAAENPDLR